MKKIKGFLHDIEKRVHHLERDMAVAQWNFSITGQKEFQNEAADLEIRYLEIIGNPALFKDLENYHGMIGLEAEDRRMVDLLYRRSKKLQVPREMVEVSVVMQKEIEAIFNNFRAHLDGKKVTDNQILDILHHSCDPEERKRAWEASKEIAVEAAPKVLELVRLRNRMAKTLGYNDYYMMSLALDELDQKRLFSVLGDLARETDQFFHNVLDGLKKSLSSLLKTPIPKIFPWHLQDPFFQNWNMPQSADLDQFYKGKDLVALTRRFYHDIGLDIEDIIARADLFEKEGKSQHAFCMSVDRADDIRILCNVRDNEKWMGTMLHEFGHGVYDKYINRRLPYFLREPAHTLFTEAIAMMFDRWSNRPDFLELIVGVSHREIADILPTLQQNAMTKQIVFARWTMVMTHFERDMYHNPDQDLNGLWWHYVEKYQFVNRPEKRNAPDWASKIHLACCPVYYQNYILGELVASQFEATIRREILHDGKIHTIIGEKKVGEFLKEKIFMPGCRENWETTLHHATGENLKPAYFAKDFIPQ